MTKTADKTLAIGGVKLDNPFFLAPMAGITDASMRRICREMGASLTYTEMISTKGIFYGDKKTERLLFKYKEETPAAVQIFGHEPEVVEYAARHLDKYDFDILDINMGCPVPKIVKSFDGSFMMTDPGLCGDVVKAAKRGTGKPVTVKIRLSFGEGKAGSVTSADAAGLRSPEDRAKMAIEVARAVEAAGAAAIAVHGRTREQFYSGTADWEAIAAVRKAVGIPVIANGDVRDVESARRIMQVTGCDFVMVGRAVRGNPWIFRDLKEAWDSGYFDEAADAAAGNAELVFVSSRVTAEDRKNMMLRQLAELVDEKGEYAAVREMRKIAGWYLHGMPGGAKLRAAFNQITDADVMRGMILEI